LSFGDCESQGKYYFGNSGLCLNTCPAELLLEDTMCACRKGCTSCQVYLRNISASCVSC
jgi:hypothetical protein